MKILISGSTGLVGPALVDQLRASGHEVAALVRRPSRAEDEIEWYPDRGERQAEAGEGFDAVGHLAGENGATSRWSGQKKAAIRDSRVHSTALLVGALAACSQPPKVLVNASAIGYYGNRGSELLNEKSSSSDDFLSKVCQAWEAQMAPAEDKGIRAVRMRVGVVLSSKGGALAKMLLPFRLGLGGRIGNGEQYISWISLDDTVGAFIHALTNDELSGAVNCVASEPATNTEFTKALGRVLQRPTIFPMPAFATRLVFGEMGDALLLASTRVTPTRLLDSGYKFLLPDLEGAMRQVIEAR